MSYKLRPSKPKKSKGARSFTPFGPKLEAENPLEALQQEVPQQSPHSINFTNSTSKRHIPSNFLNINFTNYITFYIKFTNYILNVFNDGIYHFGEKREYAFNVLRIII